TLFPYTTLFRSRSAMAFSTRHDAGIFRPPRFRVHRSLAGHGPGDRIRRQRVEQERPTLLHFQWRLFQDGNVGALLDMAVDAEFLVRHPQASLHRRRSVLHDFQRSVLAARAVTALALHAILDVEGLVLLPVLGVPGRGVAPEADGRLLGQGPRTAQLPHLEPFR